MLRGFSWLPVPRGMKRCGPLRLGDGETPAEGQNRRAVGRPCVFKGSTLETDCNRLILWRLIICLIPSRRPGRASVLAPNESIRSSRKRERPRTKGAIRALRQSISSLSIRPGISMSSLSALLLAKFCRIRMNPLPAPSLLRSPAKMGLLQILAQSCFSMEGRQF